MSEGGFSLGLGEPQTKDGQPGPAKAAGPAGGHCAHGLCVRLLTSGPAQRPLLHEAFPDHPSCRLEMVSSPLGLSDTLQSLPVTLVPPYLRSSTVLTTSLSLGTRQGLAWLTLCDHTWTTMLRVGGKGGGHAQPPPTVLCSALLPTPGHTLPLLCPGQGPAGSRASSRPGPAYLQALADPPVEDSEVGVQGQQHSCEVHLLVGANGRNHFKVEGLQAGCGVQKRSVVRRYQGTWLFRGYLLVTVTIYFM